MTKAGWTRIVETLFGLQNARRPGPAWPGGLAAPAGLSGTGGRGEVEPLGMAGASPGAESRVEAPLRRRSDGLEGAIRFGIGLAGEGFPCWWGWGLVAYGMKNQFFSYPNGVDYVFDEMFTYGLDIGEWGWPTRRPANGH